MSGLLCILNADGAPIDPLVLSDLTLAMAYRGPDAQATWSSAHVGFGHALLRATGDASSEHQPMSLDGMVWITADARVDGRADLIAQLRAHGRTVVTDAPDVELILHAYLVWGEACLGRLIGDWAFVIWDAHRQRLFCAHDQFGVVPLYYVRTGSWLLVSNTLSALLRHPEATTTLNEQAVADFLLRGINQDLTTTFFAGIRRLAPGEQLTWSTAGLRIETYWSLPQDVEPVHYRRAADYIEHFRTIFDAAVGDRLRTDTAGTHLSGGLDSSSIAVTARRLLLTRGHPFDLRAYTIVYEDLIEDDERHYAGLVATAHDLPVEYLVAEDFLLRAPDPSPPYLYPEPAQIADQMAETEILYRVAAFGRVLLAGFGGDPAFATDDDYLRKLVLQGHAHAALLAIWRHGVLHRSLRGLALRSLLHNRRSGGPAPTTSPVWLDQDFASRVDLATQQHGPQSGSSLRGRSGMGAAPLWSTIFAWSDPGFSGVPVKVRFPFFDMRLVDYLHRMPSVPWLKRKGLLRAAMRGVLPEPVRRRPKTILRGHPHLAWLRRQGSPVWVDELLALPELAQFVDGAVARSALQSPEQLTPETVRYLMPVLSLAYWLRHRRADMSRTGNML